MSRRAGRATLGGLMALVVVAALMMGLARAAWSAEWPAALLLAGVLVAVAPPVLTLAVIWLLGALGLVDDGEPRPGTWRRRQAVRPEGRR